MPNSIIIWIKRLLNLPNGTAEKIVGIDNEDNLIKIDPPVEVPPGSVRQAITYNSSNQPVATGALLFSGEPSSYSGIELVTDGEYESPASPYTKLYIVNKDETGACIEAIQNNSFYHCVALRDLTEDRTITILYLNKEGTPAQGFYINCDQDKFYVKGNGTIRSNTLSPSKPVRTNASKELVSETFDYCRWRGIFPIPPANPIDGDVYLDTSNPDSFLRMYANGTWRLIG